MQCYWSRVAIFVCVGLLAGCGGGAHSSSSLPPATQSRSSKASVTFIIDAPQQSSTQSAHGVRPQYLSPATASMTIDITGPTNVDETVGLTLSSSGCTSTLASVVCTLTIPGLQPGDYTATLTTYDQTGGTGNVLSEAQAIPFTITAGQSNDVDLTLSGVPARTIVVPSDAWSTGGLTVGYDLLGQGAHAFDVYSVDADGNIIVGSGAPLFTIGTPSGALTGLTISPSTTTPSAPNAFSITPPTTFVGGTAAFTVTPTFAGEATNPCGGTCTGVTVTVDMAVVVYVTNQLNNTVTYYNASGTQEGSFSAGLNNPSGIAYDPSNEYLYVANLFNNTVTYYNASGTEEGSFSADLDFPSGIAYDANDEYLYVTNNYNSTVTYYNASGTEEGSFSNGLLSPFGIAYDANDEYLYVTNNNGVTYYNGYGTLEGRFSTGLNVPLGIAYDLGNEYLYVAIAENNTVTYYLVNDDGNVTEEGSFSNGLNAPPGIAYDPGNGYLYVANGGNNTVTYYNASGTQEGSFSTGLNSPFSIAIVP
jgi:DNA-binding beta-propeller fold protein YncE